MDSGCEYAVEFRSGADEELNPHSEFSPQQKQKANLDTLTGRQASAGGNRKGNAPCSSSERRLAERHPDGYFNAHTIT